jgi:DNA-directed RNA polymerase subunit E'/Rpb7
MFVLALLADTIRVPPHLLSSPTLNAVSSIIERRYPNRIVIDVGLVICPYGPPLEVGDGILVPGDGGSHHQVIFRCLVFRPFVEEVLVGVVISSHGGGVTVSVGGFFDQVFIPAYWMLNPSSYDEDSGLWVWTPNYDDEGGKDDGGHGDVAEAVGVSGEWSDGMVKREEDTDEVDEMMHEADKDAADGGGGVHTEDKERGGGWTTEDDAMSNRYVIEIGSEIRFKVKAVNFTRITTTMKGVQATTTTTTTTSHASSSDPTYGPNGSGGPKSPSSAEYGNNGNGTVDGNGNGVADDDDHGAAVRRRSSSADLSDAANHPAPMQIVGSICEDGLGLIGWWKSYTNEEEGGEAAEYCDDDDGGAEDLPVGNGMKMEEEEEEG